MDFAFVIRQRLLHPLVLGDEDVVGLEIAMHDPFLVRGADTARDLRRVFDGLARRKRPLQALAKRDALEQLRNDEGQSVVRANIEDRQKVRMIDRAGGAGFLLEAPQPVGVLRECRRQDLDGHLARDARVARAVDLPRPARPEGGNDFVVTDAGAGGEDQGASRITL
jgi:hypothetical protein